MTTSSAQLRRLQTADRLRALRITMVVVFTAFSLAGLTGMALVGITVDHHQREKALLSDLRITSGAVLSLIYREAGTLRMTGVADAIGTRATGVYVFEKRGDELGAALARPGRTVGVPTIRLEAAARTSMGNKMEVIGKVTASDGTMQQMLSVPFSLANLAHPAGAVVVTIDAQASVAAQRSLAFALFGGSVAFSLFLAAAGYYLARRSTRAVELALSQQERFLADAAHELRTPLTAIRMHAEAAIQPASQHQALRKVIHAVDRLTWSVEALLTRAKLIAGTRPVQAQDFRLDQLVSEILSESGLPPHRVVADLPATVCHGDPAVLRIAIRNLVENAIGHGAVGDEPAHLEVMVGPDEVTIRDHGPGLGGRADVRERFASGSALGTGLGLSIVDWAIQLHKGQLELGDHPGGGTIARIRIGSRQRGDLHHSQTK
ncbi:sensor histidine kinase [Dactylosporangium sucinum]|uniref:histidine kinase n=1 Tax=Dactylosporangium sucinum TaxID=1424081 RepID=A0A917UDK9_9ACTN|nr:HAMP domain-containing sensor histidine kinase [Dactylosporangium sucinum]GGM78440.1 hypothetical protein GCM10007977_094950 [Dactylosporangium sucinum]